MKKAVLLTIIVLSVLGLQAQIKSFTIDGSKVYDNNTRTSYLTLVGELDKDMADVIVKELESNSDIQKFAFFDSNNLMKCMFTADKSVDEEMIVDFINEVISNYGQEEKPLGSFSKAEIYSDYMIVYFKVDGLSEADDLKSFFRVLDDDELILSVEIIDDGLFKLKTDLKLTPDYIQRMLAQFKSQINDQYLL